MDETTAKWLLIVAVVLLLILLIGIIPSIISNNKRKLITQKGANDLELLKWEGILKDKNLEIQKMNENAKAIATDLATKQLESWKENELQTHRNVIIEAALKQSKVWLAEWKIAEEKILRKDAVTRSMGVNFGKITEHLIPFSAHLENFDPRDIRFIGSPVDLMIFDGATSKRDILNIYFVEIKTGAGQLSKKQKTIRDAIENQRIHWKPIVVPEYKWDVYEENE
jgi:predicted Holliday junction resolvase-like endonuclease